MALPVLGLAGRALMGAGRLGRAGRVGHILGGRGRGSINVNASMDSKQWAKALRTWRKAKGMPAEEDVVNHFAIKTTFRAMKLSPKAKLGKKWLAKSYDPEPVRARRVLKSGRLGKSKWNDKNRAYYKLASDMGVKPPGRRKWATVGYKRNRRASGALKTGYLEPLKDLGVKVKSRPYRGGTASRSYGKKSGLRLDAMTHNMVEDSAKYGYAAARKAMLQIAHEEYKWAMNRLDKAAQSWNRG